jgi:L-malate glycosyltransferase
MRVLLLGDATTPHIINWANNLHASGIEIYIFSLEEVNAEKYNEGIKVYCSQKYSGIKKKDTGALSKALYLLVVPEIRKLIKRTKPDLVHAHYGSSYGLIGALAGFHPYLISIWGSDVVDFPETSPLHRWVFKYSLSKAERILSTSPFMAKLLNKYTDKKVDITPFGIDTKRFNPGAKDKFFSEEVDCVVGTVKSLEWYYGIEYLINSFHIVLKKLPDKKLKLLIVGGGALESKIRKQIKELNIEDKVTLTGKIAFNEVNKYHNILDIFIAISVYDETFGVAVLEASACEKPVIISRVGGMKELVIDKVTGFIVEPKNAEETAIKMIELINNVNLRKEMGKRGRELVLEKYELKKCVKKMTDIYEELI